MLSILQLLLLLRKCRKHFPLMTAHHITSRNFHSACVTSEVWYNLLLLLTCRSYFVKIWVILLSLRLLLVLMVALYLLRHFEFAAITSLLRSLAVRGSLVARSSIFTAGRLYPSGLLRCSRMTLMSSLSQRALFDKLSARLRTLDISRFRYNRSMWDHIFSIFHSH